VVVCEAGFGLELGNGTCVGVSTPVTCEGSFCEDVSQCGRTFYLSKGASGGDGTREKPFADLANLAKVTKSGDCVLISPGRYPGAELQGGVSLLGAGAKTVTIIPRKGSNKVLSFVGGGGGTIRGLAIAEGAGVGLLLENTQGIRIEQVKLNGIAGVALYAKASRSLVLDQVAVRQTKSGKVGSSSGVAMGIVLANGTSAKISNSLVDGNAQLGILVSESSIDMTSSVIQKNGSQEILGSCGAAISCRKDKLCKSSLGSRFSDVVLERNHGVGLVVAAAKVDLDRIHVVKTGLGGGLSRGISVPCGGTLSLSKSTVSGGKGQGIVIDGGTYCSSNPDPIITTLKDNTVSKNLGRGIWLQNITAGEGNVRLEQNIITDNLLIGVGCTNTTGMLIKGGKVSGTIKTPVVVSKNFKEIGDGIQVLASSSASVQGVTFANNGRVSLIFDGSRGKAINNTFSRRSGNLPELVVQNESKKDVEIRENRDDGGALVIGVEPKTRKDSWAINQSDIKLNPLPPDPVSTTVP